MTPNLARLMEEADTLGTWKDFILDEPKDSIGSYIQACVEASGGDDFYFISAPHADGGEADIAHIGNGPKGKVHARLITIFLNHGPALVAALEEWVALTDGGGEMEDIIVTGERLLSKTKSLLTTLAEAAK